MSALPQAELPDPTIHEYMGMGFNNDDEVPEWKKRLKKTMKKKYGK